MLQLYTAPTPNGWKASCTLEELGLQYETHAVDLQSGAQKREDFLAINPNGRIPALVDDGVPVFESGAIMIHLAEKTGRLLPAEGAARARTLSWLMFQMGGIGPMMGQANVFYRYFPEKIPAAIARYQNESRRLFEVVERGLRGSEWLGGAEFSIADIANWCWIRTHKWSGVSTDGLPNLARWNDAMYARPACKRGIAVPVKLPNLGDDPEAAKKFAENARKSVQT